MIRFIISIPKYCMIGLVKFYQKFINKLFPHKCAFVPCCSQYFIEALKSFGFFKGSCLGFRRIFRCNPKNHGKVDELPKNIKGEYKWLI